MRFDMICEANGIDLRLTKPNHPWTHGQVEWMYRTTKDATVKRFHFDSHNKLRTLLADFMAAPTTSPAGSRPSAASRLRNTSTKSGHQSRVDSLSTRSSRCRD
jgi:hypothetical protein